MKAVEAGGLGLSPPGNLPVVQRPPRSVPAMLGKSLRRHWLALLLVLVAAVLGTYGVALFITDQYEAQARLLVKLGRENTEVPQSVGKGGVLSTGVRKEEINSEIQILTSRDLLRETVDRLGVDAFKLEPPPPRTLLQRIKHEVRKVVRSARRWVEDTSVLLGLSPALNDEQRAVKLLESSLKVERERDSDVIGASLRLPDPGLATRALTVLVDLYLERHVEVRRDPALTAMFNEKTDTLRQQMVDLERRSRQVRSQRNVSALAEQRAQLLRRLHASYSETASLEQELGFLGRARPVSPGDDPAASVEAGRAQALPVLATLKERVTGLRLRRTELLYKFTPEADPVQAVDREIFEAEASMRSAVAGMLQAQRQTQRRLETELAQLDTGESELTLLEQDRQLAQQSLLTYARRRDESLIADQLDRQRVSNVSLIAPVESPTEPHKSRKRLIVLLSLPFGILLGLGVAFLLTWFDPKVRDEDDLLEIDGAVPLGTLRVR